MKKTVVFVVGAIALAVALGVTFLPSPTPCQQATQYVASHPVPQTAAQFYATPATFRTHTFAAISPSLRAALMKARVQAVADLAPLTPPQRQFLLQLANELTGDLYDPNMADATLPTKKAQEARAMQLFTRDQIAALSQLPDPNEPVVLTVALRDVQCNCSIGSWFNMKCGGSTPECRQGDCVEPPIMGCGFLGYYICDGLCQKQQT